MVSGIELDRLREAKEHSFNQRRKAFRALGRAWNTLTEVRTPMDQAHKERQRLYYEQNISWQQRQSLLRTLEQVETEWRIALQKMECAFHNASLAHTRKNAANAISYTLVGRGFETVAHHHAKEYRRIDEQFQSACASHDALMVLFRQAQAEFNAYRQPYIAAKDRHEHARIEFEHTKADFRLRGNALSSGIEAFRARAQRERRDKSRS